MNWSDAGKKELFCIKVDFESQIFRHTVFVSQLIIKSSLRMLNPEKIAEVKQL